MLRKACVLQKVFKIFDNIIVRNKEYYVQMAIAWAISSALIKYYDDTVKYLQICKLDKFTFNKSIQKAIESYRIDNNKKESLKMMKKL